MKLRDYARGVGALVLIACLPFGIPVAIAVGLWSRWKGKR